jgi:hypothetical protein
MGSLTSASVIPNLASVAPGELGNAAKIIACISGTTDKWRLRLAHSCIWQPIGVQEYVLVRCRFGRP